MLRLCAADKLTSLLRAVVETLEPLAGAQACKQPYAAAMEDSMASLGEAVVVSRRLIAELAELQQQGGEVGGRGGGGVTSTASPSCRHHLTSPFLLWGQAAGGSAEAGKTGAGQGAGGSEMGAKSAVLAKGERMSRAQLRQFSAKTMAETPFSLLRKRIAAALERFFLTHVHSVSGVFEGALEFLFLAHWVKPCVL